MNPTAGADDEEEEELTGAAQFLLSAVVGGAQQLALTDPARPGIQVSTTDAACSSTLPILRLDAPRLRYNLTGLVEVSLRQVGTVTVSAEEKSQVRATMYPPSHCI